MAAGEEFSRGFPFHGTVFRHRFTVGCPDFGDGQAHFASWQHVGHKVPEDLRHRIDVPRVI